MSLCHQHAEYDNRNTKTGCRTSSCARLALKKISAQKTFICRKFVRMLNICVITPSPLYLQASCPHALEHRYALQISYSNFVALIWAACSHSGSYVCMTPQVRCHDWDDASMFWRRKSEKKNRTASREEQYQLVLLSYHPIFLRPYHFLKLVSFLGANRTKSASVCLWLLRGAI